MWKAVLAVFLLSACSEPGFERSPQVAVNRRPKPMTEAEVTLPKFNFAASGSAVLHGKVNGAISLSIHAERVNSDGTQVLDLGFTASQVNWVGDDLNVVRTETNFLAPKLGNGRVLFAGRPPASSLGSPAGMPPQDPDPYHYAPPPPAVARPQFEEGTNLVTHVPLVVKHFTFHVSSDGKFTVQASVWDARSFDYSGQSSAPVAFDFSAGGSLVSGCDQSTGEGRDVSTFTGPPYSSHLRCELALGPLQK